MAKLALNLADYRIKMVYLLSKIFAFEAAASRRYGIARARHRADEP